MQVARVGVAFVLAIVTTAWILLALVLTPCLMLALVPVAPLARAATRVYRFFRRIGQWMWMSNVVVMLELMFGIKVVISGDAATAAQQHRMKGERALWVSNHRTCIDWLLLWCLAFRTQTLSTLRIVLKAPLRKMPIFGWAMQHLFFIFLHRQWSEDQVMLEQKLPVLASKENGSSYLLFPEGTDLCEESQRKGAAFAKKQGLAVRKFTLYPRTTGWTFMVPRLRASLDAVYDVTMFYVDYAPQERPSEASLISGRAPRTIFIHVERTPIEELPESEAGLSDWLHARFTKKETMLKTYYEENGKLPADAKPIFADSQTATFRAIITLWIVTMLVTMYYAWMWARVCFVGTIVLAMAYDFATKYTCGIDGLLMKIL